MKKQISAITAGLIGGAMISVCVARAQTYEVSGQDPTLAPIIVEAGADDARTIPPPPPASQLQHFGTFKPSFYWIALETSDGEKKDQKLLDVDGNVLATVSLSYSKKLEMEGTGRLLDGRIINYKSRIDHPDGTKEIRYRICGQDAPFGFGLGDIPLVPFRTVAVDTTVIPIGTKLYLPDARGTILPDGSVHDGIFVARDIGDLIQSKRLDIFTSFGDQSSVFAPSGIVHMKPLEVYIVK